MKLLGNDPAVGANNHRDHWVGHSCADYSPFPGFPRASAALLCPSVVTKSCVLCRIDSDPVKFDEFLVPVGSVLVAPKTSCLAL